MLAAFKIRFLFIFSREVLVTVQYFCLGGRERKIFGSRFLFSLPMQAWAYSWQKSRRMELQRFPLDYMITQ